MKNFVNKFLIALALTGAFAVPSTVAFAQKMDLGTQARYGSTAWTVALATVPDFTITGANYTINSSVWTIGSNYTATRAAGTLAAGNVGSLQANVTTLTGNAAGNNTVQAWRYDINPTGANNFTSITGTLYRVNYDASLSGTVTVGRALEGNYVTPGTGNTTTGVVFDARFNASGANTITTADAFRVVSPAVTSGAITTHNGLHVQNIGNASVGTAVGVKVDNFTNSPTAMRGIQSSIASGAGKANLYLDGTADNLMVGNVRIGSTTAPTVALDVTGAALISTTLGVTGIQTNSNKIYPGTDAGATQSAAGIYAGTGAPNNANGSNGDIYIRSDGGALTTIYQRRAGAWVGII